MGHRINNSVFDVDIAFVFLGISQRYLFHFSMAANDRTLLMERFEFQHIENKIRKSIDNCVVGVRDMKIFHSRNIGAFGYLDSITKSIEVVDPPLI